MKNKCYFISSSYSFIEYLAYSIMLKYLSNLEELQNLYILLPNRKSVTDFKKAFCSFEHRFKFKLSLPKVFVIGNIDLKESEFSINGLNVEDKFISENNQKNNFLTEGSFIGNQPDRKFVQQAEIILRLTKYIVNCGVEGQRLYSSHEAFDIAKSVFMIVRELNLEGIFLNNIHNVLDQILAEFSLKYQITISLLLDIVAKWDQFILADEIDDVSYQKFVIEKQISFFEREGKNSKVIIAGSGGSVYLTRRLYKTILGLEHSFLVLPSILNIIDQDRVDLLQKKVRLDKSHSKFSLVRLLNYLGVDLISVKKLELKNLLPKSQKNYSQKNIVELKGQYKQCDFYSKLNFHVKYLESQYNPIREKLIDDVILFDYSHITSREIIKNEEKSRKLKNNGDLFQHLEALEQDAKENIKEPINRVNKINLYQANNLYEEAKFIVDYIENYQKNLDKSSDYFSLYKEENKIAVIANNVILVNIIKTYLRRANISFRHEFYEQIYNLPNLQFCFSLIKFAKSKCDFLTLLSILKNKFCFLSDKQDYLVEILEKDFIRGANPHNYEDILTLIAKKGNNQELYKFFKDFLDIMSPLRKVIIQSAQFFGSRLYSIEAKNSIDLHILFKKHLDVIKIFDKKFHKKSVDNVQNIANCGFNKLVDNCNNEIKEAIFADDKGKCLLKIFDYLLDLFEQEQNQVENIDLYEEIVMKHLSNFTYPMKELFQSQKINANICKLEDRLERNLLSKDLDSKENEDKGERVLCDSEKGERVLCDSEKGERDNESKSGNNILDDGVLVEFVSVRDMRLSKYPLMILTGLNEGSFPYLDHNSLWINDYIFDRLSLTTQKERIGLSYNDFLSYLGAKNILLTRSKQEQGNVTHMSQFLFRLDLILTDSERDLLHKGENVNFLAQKQQFTKPDFNRIKQLIPTPSPELEARPTKLSVTQIEMLMRDPYSIYASEILKLRKLKEIDKGVYNSDFGNFIHKVLEVFVLGVNDFLNEIKREIAHKFNVDIYDLNISILYKDYYNITIELLEKRLLSLAQKVFKQEVLNTDYKSLWMPKLEYIAKRFIREELKLRYERPNVKIFCEETIEKEFDIDLDSFKFEKNENMEEVNVKNMDFDDKVVNLITSNDNSNKNIDNDKIDSDKIGSDLHKENYLNNTKSKTDLLNNAFRKKVRFILKAKVDRIEISEKKFTIIDYKTGRVPNNREIKQGIVSQLQLAALILQDQKNIYKFFDFQNVEICFENLAYRLVKGLSRPQEKDLNIVKDIAQLITEADLGLKQLLSYFFDSDSCYFSCPNLEIMPKYSDYEHLARIKEWELI